MKYLKYHQKWFFVRQISLAMDGGRDLIRRRRQTIVGEKDAEKWRGMREFADRGEKNI